MHAVQHILRLGKGTQLVKVDLRQAYRQIPVQPEDHYLLGLSWEGSVYVDRALPFGLRSAPKIFTAVANMIAWAFHMAGIQDQIHYLDDFLFLSLLASAPNLLQSALAMLEYLGVPVAREKVEGPACQVTFLGVVIDTVALELRLPHMKIEKLQACWELGLVQKPTLGRSWSPCYDIYRMPPLSCVLGERFFTSFLCCCMEQRPPITLFECQQEQGLTWHGGSVSLVVGMGHH